MRRALAIVLVLAAPAFAADKVSVKNRAMPEPVYVPGVARALSLKEICTTKWGLDRRKVTAAMKQVVRERDAAVVKACRSCKRGIEIDHKDPRCAGGDDVDQNLEAQCYCGEWNAVMKDRVEVRVCKEICDHYPEPGTLSPDEALAKFNDWKKSYIEYFGNPYGE